MSHCVLVDWVSCMDLCIGNSGGNIEHVVSIKASVLPVFIIFSYDSIYYNCILSLACHWWVGQLRQSSYSKFCHLCDGCIVG